MNWVKFLFEFFKIGALTYGGGLAMIPILRDVAINHKWLTDGQFANLIAISQATPGPIGINMATYVGYRELSFLGAILASVILILPSFILAIIVGKFLSEYSKHRRVKAAFVGLKATVIGLIGTSVIQVALVSLYGLETGRLIKPWVGLDWRSVVMLIVAFVLIKNTQKHPLTYILGFGVISVFIW